MYGKLSFFIADNEIGNTVYTKPRKLDKQREHSTSLSRCPVCKYFPQANRYSELTNGENVLKMTSTKGFGRTGNYILSAARAVKQAHACKAVIILPEEDDYMDIYEPPAGTNILDFTSRPGGIHPSCKNVYGLSGDASIWWNPPAMDIISEEEMEFHRDYDDEANEIAACLRRYFGFCSPTFCKEFENLDSSLVLHIRHDDIFPANFDPNVDHGYGQPPLSYYLSAIGHKKWAEIIVVAQDSLSTSPVYQHLSMLSRLNILMSPILFRNSSWKSDFRLLVCAKNLVHSRSSLWMALDLGFARNIYSFRCMKPFQLDTSVYYIHFNQTRPFWKDHRNTAEQWIQILLDSSSHPLQCKQ